MTRLHPSRNVTASAALFLITACSLLVPRICGAPQPRSTMPSSLLECYANETLYEHATRLTPTLSTLIALIAKVERSGSLNMDMRSLSASLLHRFRVDGIQRDPEVPLIPGIVPFTPSGRQHAKYKVVVDQLLPPGGSFPEDALKDFEKCALHFMLSASVQPWERGDEHEVCPLAIGGRSRRPITNKPKSWSEWPSPADEADVAPRRAGLISRCPTEEGVVWTPWGAVNAGTLLAGVAAALQPQRVPLSLLMERSGPGRDDSGTPLDNTWAATLAGDLAEVAVYQGPRAPDPTYLRLGPGGRWNDSAVTRLLYFDPWIGPQGGWEQESWDLTEAELRGGIDGLVLGSRLPGWLSLLGSLRLSQLLDMFYSERGVVMEPAVRACRRADLEAQVVLKPTLKQQTESFAKVLYDHVSTVPIKPSALTKFTNSAVDAYGRFSETVLWRDTEIAPCAEGMQPTARIELLTVLDGSWTTWEGQRVISFLDRYTDVSAFGSAIAVMNGWSGLPIVNFTRLSTYAIRTLEDPESWPVGLDMERTVRGARQMLMRRRALEARRGENVSANSRGTVVLILAPTATNDATTLERAREEMRQLRGALPDVTFLVVTARRTEDYTSFVDNPKRDIIIAQDAEVESFLPALIHRLREVPGRILPAMCPTLVQKALAGESMTEWVPVEPKGPHFEDYVTPGEARLYRVSSPLLHGSTRVKFTLRSSNYGDLVVCISRGQPGVDSPPPPFPSIADKDEERCESLLASSELRLVINEPCPDVRNCKPIFLWLTVQQTSLKCTEADCRFPDQVRFSMWHEGLQDLPGCVTAAAASHSSLLTLCLAIAATLLIRHT